MKYALLATLLAVASIAGALDGQIGIHDPSTVVLCDGKYYTFGTGGTALVSDDGWTWRAGTRAPRAGMAPDLIHIGDRYYQYIARNVGAQPKAEINMIWSKSLDPNSPDYKWVEGGVVVSTDGIEDCNGIDPGAFLDPTTGKLWLTYGSYFGYIRVVELDPKTGHAAAIRTLKPFDIAINCEASTMIYRDGWYYLLATHGSCCRGADSGYNIRVGRGRKPTGPFLDDNGIDMIQGGGKLVIGSGGRVVGAGHFGLLDLGDGVQKFSMHWEADLDRGGASVIDIRPLLWKDGWPVAGENAKEGTYEIESLRTGTALELAVEGIPVGGRRAGRGGAWNGSRRWRRRRAGAPGGAPRPVDRLGRTRRGAASRRPRGRRSAGRRGSGPWRHGRRHVRRDGLSAGRSGRETGFGELAIRQPGRPHEQLPVPGAAEVDAEGRPERRRLSRLSVLQDHGGRNGPHAGRHGRGRSGCAARVHRRSGTAVAAGSACRWFLADHAEGRAERQDAHGALRDRREQRDALEVRSGRQQAPLAAQDAVDLRLGV